MKKTAQKLTLSRETLRTLDAAPRDTDRTDNVRYPTTTVMTRFRTCTC